MDTDAYHPWLDHPGALIAALPALLGFVPEQSMVLVTMDGGELACAMRADLGDDALGTARRLAEVAALSRPDLVVLIFVDDGGAACRMCNEEYGGLADEIAMTLDARAIALWAALAVDRVADGGRWHCIDGCGLSGAVDDPTSSPVAAAAVLNGRRLYARRDDLVDAVAPMDSQRAQELCPAIEAAAHAGGDRPHVAARRDVEHVIDTAAALATGGEVPDGDMVRIACALTDPRVRDTLYALCVGPTGGEAEALFSTLARALPGPWRAEALVLLAFAAYARGDGPLAGVSLEAALRCNPAHRMAAMLDQALQSGMRPERIRDLARTGYRMAGTLGVTLPTGLRDAG